MDNNGKVTALKIGTTTISATAQDGSGKSASCKITVKKRPVTSIKLNRQSLNLEVGDSFTIKATVNPSKATNKTLSWKSSNTSIATVNNRGEVTALKVGKVTITSTAKDGSGKKATCTIVIE